MTPSSRPVAAIGKIGANGRQGLGDHSPFAVFQFGALPGDEPGRSCGGSGRCAPLSGSRRSGGPRPWAIFLDQGLSRPIPRRRRSRPQRPLALRNARTPRKQNSGSLSPLSAPVFMVSNASNLRSEHQSGLPHRARRVELGIPIEDWILPLSSTPLCPPPFWVAAGRLLARA
jgi:hypothetical protein